MFIRAVSPSGEWLPAQHSIPRLQVELSPKDRGRFADRRELINGEKRGMVEYLNYRYVCLNVPGTGKAQIREKN